jgi:hypothetical protein
VLNDAVPVDTLDAMLASAFLPMVCRVQRRDGGGVFRIRDDESAPQIGQRRTGHPERFLYRVSDIHKSTELTMPQTIAIERVDHIGIRVRDLDRALAFYRVLGFTLTHRAVGDDVAIVRNERGVELNLIFNADAGDPDSNILMDVGTNSPATRTWRCA